MLINYNDLSRIDSFIIIMCSVNQYFSPVCLVNPPLSYVSTVNVADDHSRVILQTDDDNTSDYINACYITVSSSPDTFVEWKELT